MVKVFARQLIKIGAKVGIDVPYDRESHPLKIRVQSDGKIVRGRDFCMFSRLEMAANASL